MEVKALKMNIGKTKVMFSNPTTITIKEKNKWPCVCVIKELVIAQSCTQIVRNAT